MNLETLLEAAKYVEYSSKAKARGEEPHDYDTFGRLYAREEASPTGPRHRSVACKQDGEPPAGRPDASKERRRSGGGQLSREPPILGDEIQGGGGTREVHNKLEKNRRAHLKECFETLKRQLPNMEERKTSNLSILRGALRYIQVSRASPCSRGAERRRAGRGPGPDCAFPRCRPADRLFVRNWPRCFPTAPTETAFRSGRIGRGRETKIRPRIGAARRYARSGAVDRSRRARRLSSGNRATRKRRWRRFRPPIRSRPFFEFRTVDLWSSASVSAFSTPRFLV
ncbi:uncharacterized protein LOC111634976 [Centruroides sculpturatus]|uniref:uncharacterized protein LOC111634976 n=1 Tax=Centruroides sculpturatus TaxID=218467 RepID=UPI000C6CCF07|nr:uncharacterized protein LOC111634976 [Centruroides sculpturatus]